MAAMHGRAPRILIADDQKDILSSGICALASMIPALRATRVNVIDTLRYE